MTFYECKDSYFERMFVTLLIPNDAIKSETYFLLIIALYFNSMHDKRACLITSDPILLFWTLSVHVCVFVCGLQEYEQVCVCE